MKKDEISFAAGLRPLPPDNRDFSHDVVFGTLEADEIPSEDFDVAQPLGILDQQNLDFCPAFSGVAVSSDQEGVPFDPYWQFAMMKRIEGGDVRAFGTDMRTACKSFVKYGSLPASLAPYSYPEKDRDFLADYRNYDENLLKKAEIYQKRSFFKIDGPHDTFDNLRSSLWKHRAERCTALVGALWRHGWTYAPQGLIPSVYGPGEVPHMFKIFGQKTFPGESEPRLKAQLSSGTSIGDGGIFYFPRSVVNQEFGQYGQMMLVDIPQEKAREYNEKGISVDDSFLVKAFKSFISLFKNHV